MPDERPPVLPRALHAAVSFIALIAWLSLGAQVEVLIGSRGLTPIAPYFAVLTENSLGFFDFPTLLWWANSDAALLAGVVVGALLSLLALIGSVSDRLSRHVMGRAVRPSLAVMAVLYLSYVVAGRSFFGFQWDNLLIECTVLAALTPRDRPSRWATWAIRLLLFKLYFESGIAKAQSHLHDWQDGSAMRFYYETAPIPTRLAWYAHALPAGWHKLESWLTLVWEIGAPFAIFGPRRARHVAIAVFTAFQLVNIATANYGFFSYLALALNVALLDEEDVSRAICWVKKGSARGDLTPGPSPPQTDAAERGGEERNSSESLLGALRNLSASSSRLGRYTCAHATPLCRIFLRWRGAGGEVSRFLAPALFAFYVAYSLLDGLATFAFDRGDAPFVTLRAGISRLRLINTYHLFGHITRERIEPDFQVMVDGQWRSLALRYKPGPLDRPPSFVAPHQPRVDFMLWFHGLSFRQSTPEYVLALRDRLCNDPSAVASLFATDLPASPEAVRTVYWRYQLTSSPDLAPSPAASPRSAGGTSFEHGTWWARTQLAASRVQSCK